MILRRECPYCGRPVIWCRPTPCDDCSQFIRRSCIDRLDRDLANAIVRTGLLALVAIALFLALA
jgi:hypothetical protein